MNMDGSTSSTGMGGDSFCMGEGAVMLKGFQTASEATANCVLFLFEDAVVDSKAKYAFAVIGAFLMGFMNEMIRYNRDRMAPRGNASSCLSDLSRTLLFAVQMALAYFLMLLVMLYEYVFFIAIILGLSMGHLLTLRLAASRRRLNPQEAAAASADGQKLPQYAANSGTPCCNNTTSA